MSQNNSIFLEIIENLNRKGHTDSSISLKTGRNEGYVSQLKSRMKSGGTVPTKFIELLRLHYASLNDSAKPVYNDIMPVKVVEISAQAGYSRGGFADDEYIDALPETFVTREYESGNYLVFTINGDSMDNGGKRALLNGDKVLAKELPKLYWQSKLHYRQYLFIVVYKGGCVCKEITSHDVQTGDIVLHSWNPVYEDKKINLKEVYQLFYIKRIVERPITL